MAFLDGIQTESDVPTSIRARSSITRDRITASALPISGGDGGGAARGATISADLSHRHGFQKPDERVSSTLGIGITVPFGEMVDYDPHWVGRYELATLLAAYD